MNHNSKQNYIKDSAFNLQSIYFLFKRKRNEFRLKK